MWLERQQWTLVGWGSMLHPFATPLIQGCPPTAVGNQGGTHHLLQCRRFHPPLGARNTLH